MQLDKQQAQVALQFMNRVTLQPAEIAAFTQCVQALQAVVQGPIEVPHPPEATKQAS